MGSEESARIELRFKTLGVKTMEPTSQDRKESQDSSGAL